MVHPQRHTAGVRRSAEVDRRDVKEVEGLAEAGAFELRRVDAENAAADDRCFRAIRIGASVLWLLVWNGHR